MDTKNRIRSVVIGDIEGKLISGVYFSSLVNRVHEAMRPEPQSAAPAEQTEPTYNYPPGTYGGHRGAPGTPPVPNSGELHQWPPATGTPEVTPVTPTPPLEGAVPAGWSEHIVTPRDILDNLLGERYVYSPQIIEWFKVNHGNMVSIWEKMASANPNHMVPIEMGPDAQIQYMTVEQVREKLDWLIAHGYQPGDAEAQAWVERLDKWLTPGSKIYLPPGVK